jgi:hypothetical protein
MDMLLRRSSPPLLEGAETKCIRLAQRTTDVQYGQAIREIPQDKSPLRAFFSTSRPSRNQGKVNSIDRK